MKYLFYTIMLLLVGSSIGIYHFARPQTELKPELKSTENSSDSESLETNLVVASPSSALPTAKPNLINISEVIEPIEVKPEPMVSVSDPLETHLVPASLTNVEKKLPSPRPEGEVRKMPYAD